MKMVGRFKKFLVFFAISIQIPFYSSFALGDIEISAKNDEIIKDIEKSLLFDKSSREKINVYQKKRLSKKSDFVINSGGEENSVGKKEEIEIVVIDPSSENFDLREKEKLAYNAALVGQYEIAAELYRQVLVSEPKNNYSKFSLAVIYQKLGQNSQAKSLYQDLLKLNLDNDQEIIGNLLAIIIDESPKDASYLLSRLTTQNPDSAYILAQASLAYAKNKEYEKAAKLLEKSIAIEPGNIDYKYNLAIIYDKTSQTDKAINMYSEVEESYSNDKSQSISISQVENRLKTLRSKI